MARLTLALVVMVVMLAALVLPVTAQDPNDPEAEDTNGWQPPIDTSSAGGGIQTLSYTNRLLGTVISPPRYIPDFSLPSTTGEDFTFNDYRGDILMIYFGYLTCPDVCPATMGDLLRAYRDIGEPENVKVVFITIDPERDTLDYMGRYVNAFHENFVGVRPENMEQVDEIAKSFGLIYERREVDSAVGYLMDHSAAVYMVAPDGRLVSQFPFGVPYTEMSNDMDVMLDYTYATGGQTLATENTFENLDPDREYRIVIPDGTNNELMMGRDPGIIPLEILLWIGERDVLVLENHDNSDYLVGGLWVAPHETVYKQFYEPQSFIGLCTVTVGRDLVEIIVDYPPESAD